MPRPFLAFHCDERPFRGRPVPCPRVQPRVRARPPIRYPPITLRCDITPWSVLTSHPPPAPFSCRKPFGRDSRPSRHAMALRSACGCTAQTRIHVNRLRLVDRDGRTRGIRHSRNRWGCVFRPRDSAALQVIRRWRASAAVSSPDDLRSAPTSPSIRQVFAQDGWPAQDTPTCTSRRRGMRPAGRLRPDANRERSPSVFRSGSSHGARSSAAGRS